MNDFIRRQPNRTTDHKSSNSDAADQTLAAMSAKGDREALETLIKRHLPLVYSIAKRYVSDADDAEDITQEVFVKIWKNLDSYQPEKSFTNWIYEIAKNSSLNWLRKKRTVPFSAFEDEYGENRLLYALADPAPTPDELASEAGAIETRTAAILRLSPVNRQVITQRDDMDMTFREIAENSRQPLNTVKSRYRRALIKLKKILTE